MKSSQLDDFLRLPEDFEAEAEADVDMELFVRFKAEGLRKIDLSAWIKSNADALIPPLLLLPSVSVTFK